MRNLGVVLKNKHKCGKIERVKKRKKVGVK